MSYFIYKNFLYPLSSWGQLGWFLFFATENNAAVDMGCRYLCGRVWGSLGIPSGAEQLGDMLVLSLLFEKSPNLFPQQLYSLKPRQHWISVPHSPRCLQHLLIDLLTMGIRTGVLRWHLKVDLMARNMEHLKQQVATCAPFSPFWEVSIPFMCSVVDWGIISSVFNFGIFW